MEHLEDKWEIWEECVVGWRGCGAKGEWKPVVIHMGGGRGSGRAPSRRN